MHFHAEDVALVDVGGDAITTGTDTGLRSPLADQLALAACVRTGIPTRLLIAGAGLDGELPYATIVERLADLDTEPFPSLTASAIRDVRGVFDWHPSEASGLLAAAAQGRRGIVEVRDAGNHVALTDATTDVSAVDAKRASTVTPAALLSDSASLAEADAVISDATGISEIAYEARKAAQLGERHAHTVTTADLASIDQHAASGRVRGADFISTRRLAELLGATTAEAFATFIDLLRTHRADSYEPSVYRTIPGP